MEGDPFAVVESMAIAAFAAGASRAYLYIRGEYPLGRGTRTAPSRDRGAAARRGRPRLRLRLRHRGPARRRRLHLRRGDGALRVDRGQARRATQQAAVPGRGRALRQADGDQQRRDARQRASHPRQRGRRRSRFAAIGTEGSTGPKLFCVSGQRRPAGRLRGRVRSDACASCWSWPAACRADGRSEAILLGGAAGVFVGPDALDVPLTFEATRAIGATLGSGVVMVFDETADLVGALRRIAQFFRDESCGQCVPCRVGTVRQEELLARLASGPRHPAPATTSWRSSARSARRCATHRSAASARPPARRSKSPSAVPELVAL